MAVIDHIIARIGFVQDTVFLRRRDVSTRSEPAEGTDQSTSPCNALFIRALGRTRHLFDVVLHVWHGLPTSYHGSKPIPRGTIISPGWPGHKDLGRGSRFSMTSFELQCASSIFGWRRQTHLRLGPREQDGDGGGEEVRTEGISRLARAAAGWSGASVAGSQKRKTIVSQSKLDDSGVGGWELGLRATSS